MSGSLFEDPEPVEDAKFAADRPLAERMRPQTLEEYLGQEIVDDGSLLRRFLAEGRLPSLLLWGPPGTGKTTLARILAQHTDQYFEDFSAVLSGVKEVRAVVAKAREQRGIDGKGTLLFVDEIHRFNKAQQDAFLPHVESGVLTLVGATTENPSFHLNAALLSRCLVLTLNPLPEAALITLAERALGDEERGLKRLRIRYAREALQAMARTSQGDARALLTRLEATTIAAASEGLWKDAIGLDTLERLTPEVRLYHDRGGDRHFDLISALHKSIRGGDPQAALYWLARMFEGGEDPMYLARRLVRMAFEDIGLADPDALPRALAAMEAYRFLGKPEGELALAQCAVDLATAPKSNRVYAAWNAVREEIRKGAVHEVPKALRNAPTGLMKDLGYGEEYEYPHDFDEAVSGMDHLPKELSGRDWYRPTKFGFEKDIRRRMAWWDEVRESLRKKGPKSR